ncbi:MAG: hypothetical protein Q8P27_03465 [Candidatus Peregrinibacteria bacterium]|nr:hypothetical protein [Candidatus Peregrinibacteria bacterium]
MTTKHRKEPGSTGEGRYFHVEVKPSKDFTSFTTHDVGRKGHSQRVTGKLKNGEWATQKWLIHKDDAYVSDVGELESEDPKIKKILDSLKGDVMHVEGDIFNIRTHRKVVERENSPQKKCDPGCPEMYFDCYEDYERYYEDLLEK